MSSQTSSYLSKSNTKQQQQQQQPVQHQVDVDKIKSSSNGDSNKSPQSPQSVGSAVETVVRMRNNKPSPPHDQQQVIANGVKSETNGTVKDSARAVLQRGLEVLSEITPEDDGSEGKQTLKNQKINFLAEIRKLDSQLDHLNHYMDKVEERIKAHNEKLMDTLRQQREEREKRRRSFHERIAMNQQEDDDFQRQISTLLNRVGISKNRASMYEIISEMEIPKTNG
ncbi:unnamed protein product [Thelazia callipaeda]|uniref:Uncharacterized protein n=1 Tax=Thelazia callipaeda TaxID=103827 RepID=A0A158RCH6_THECL|nr:unnamed protein product [Thelazia callipaeda]